MFDIFLKELIGIHEAKLNEVFFIEKTSEFVGLATPDPRPLTSEVTIFDWLRRIESWGKVIYYHKDPENFWGKKKISRKEFIKRLTDEEVNKLFGRWQIKKNKLTKKNWGCTIRREYVNFKGKKYAEQFIVDIELRKDLQ